MSSLKFDLIFNELGSLRACANFSCNSRVTAIKSVCLTTLIIHHMLILERERNRVTRRKTFEAQERSAEGTVSMSRMICQPRSSLEMRGTTL